MTAINPIGQPPNLLISFNVRHSLLLFLPTLFGESTDLYTPRLRWDGLTTKIAQQNSFLGYWWTPLHDRVGSEVANMVAVVLII
jgi:hypothetical protein